MKTLILAFALSLSALIAGEESFSAQENSVLNERHFKAEATVSQVLSGGVLAVIQYFDYETDAAGVKSKSQHLLKTVTGFIEMNPSQLVDGDVWKGPVWRTGSYKFVSTNGAERTVAKFTSNPKAALDFFAVEKQ